MSDSEQRRTVVVTGAATGLGLETARLLGERGYRVLAGVLPGQSTEALAEVPGETVVLDVTDPEHVRAAADRARALGPLRAVVNNAGIAVLGPLELTPVEELRRHFETNVLGHVALSQALLPELVQARGRLVFVGSPSGRMPVPFAGSYSASKAALAGVAETWRLELADSGVGVSLVEPSASGTPIWDTMRASLAEVLDRMDPETAERYANPRALVERRSANVTAGISPALVARAVLAAVEDRRPRARYPVGSEARMVSVWSRLPLSVRTDLLSAAARWTARTAAASQRRSPTSSA